MYTSHFSILSFGRGDTPLSLELRLQARFATPPTEDGSGLAPFPIDRRVSVPESPTLEPFSIEDEGLDADGRAIAVSVWDVSRPGDGPFFRSGTLQDLPAPSPQNPNGRIGIIAPGPEVRTIADLDAKVQQRMAETGPRTFAGATLARVMISANPLDSTTLSFTAAGIYTGPLPPPPAVTPPGPLPPVPPPPPPPGPFAFRYTGVLRLLPATDPFDTSLVVRAAIRDPVLSFFVTSTGKPLDSVLAGALSALGPLIEANVRGEVEAVLSQEITAAVRKDVLDELAPEKATLSPGAVISVQSVDVTATDVTFLASAGAFGDVIAREPGTGCSVLLFATLAGTAAAAWLA
ncbi:MAG TPA: hypothetical protein VFQ45_10070 [Longimicrobium sp.]|nr:hypothetical protein [Longimicrobium sp.]